MSASRSPKRRVQPHPIRHYERMDRRNRSEVRSCCPTSMREPHLEECTRPSHCRDKRGYSERDPARDVAARMRDEMSDQFVAYHCRWCRLWHVGRPKNAAEGRE